MATYVVMTAPGRAGPDGPEAEFVRDGFAIFAFILPWLWLLWHRLWLEALVAVSVAIALAGLGNLAGYAIAGPLLSFLVSIYVGFEGGALRIAALRRRGWSEWGTVEADNAADAETKYVVDAGFLDTPAAASPEPTPVPVSPLARPAPLHGPGLLLNPGDR